MALLPPPPVLGCAEDKADRDETFAVYSARTQADVARAHAEHRFDVFVFEPEIGAFFTKARLPRTAALFAEVGVEKEVPIRESKAFWNRPRPYVYDPARFTHPADHETNSSYPSGHSAGGTVYAELLAQLFPQKRDAILAKGRLIGWTRIEAGVHTPADIFAGRVLGQALAREFLRNPAFQADLAAARVEIEAAKAK
ncbi:MAG TPA: phosphatase PAP2 family protein [Opitutaceae bacterium]